MVSRKTRSETYLFMIKVGGFEFW